MRTRVLLSLLPLSVALSAPMCTAKKIMPSVPAAQLSMAELWEDPVDLETRDTYHGPWGAEMTPDCRAPFHFIQPKETGTNPGVIVKDSLGREWHVKQGSVTTQGDEGPSEVVLSRILSAIGYHQPPVYYAPSFLVADKSGKTRCEEGGRFRLHDDTMKERGTWSLEQNPFVDTKAYQGLLVILLMFNSSDLKNSNNSVYDVKRPGNDPEHWYVVRDLGTALGETGKIAPRRANIEFFERLPFTTGVQDGFVQFEYHGRFPELFRNRIRPDEVRWAADLLARLTDRQWSDAFRAGGFDTPVADRFIRRLHDKISEGQRLGAEPARHVIQVPFRLIQ